MEIIDIYDAAFNHKGTMERKETYKHPVWSHASHTWIFNPETRTVILQKRSPNLSMYPNTFFVSAGGAYGEGEELHHATREVEEELNIDIDFKDMTHLGRRMSALTLPSGDISRAFTDLFFYQSEKPVTDYIPDHNEVHGLYEAPIAELEQLFAGQTDQVQPTGILYDAETKTWQNDTCTATTDAFFPQFDDYYLKIMIMGERYLQNKPVCI